MEERQRVEGEKTKLNEQNKLLDLQIEEQEKIQQKFKADPENLRQYETEIKLQNKEFEREKERHEVESQQRANDTQLTSTNLISKISNFPFVSTFGSFSEFRAGDDWDIYEERLNQYFLANNIPDTKKVPVLITLLSQEVYKILKELCDPNLPASRTFAELCIILRQNFAKTISGFKERVEFYNLRQIENETVDVWYSRINHKANNCKFGNSLSDIIKDKFVTGLRRGPIFDKICEQNPTTRLDKIIEIARNKEATLLESSSTTQPNVRRFRSFGSQEFSRHGIHFNINENESTYTKKTADTTTSEAKKITIDLLEHISPARFKDSISTKSDQLSFHINYRPQVDKNFNTLILEDPYHSGSVDKIYTLENIVNAGETTSTNLASIVLPVNLEDNDKFLMKDIVVSGSQCDAIARNSNTIVPRKIASASKLLVHPERRLAKEQILFTDGSIDLPAILAGDERGLMVLARYQQKNSLNGPSRDALAHLLITNELRTDLDKRIPPERFNYLASKVVEHFPTESKETWILFNSHGRCVTGKGKFYISWYSLRRKWQLLGLIPRYQKEQRSRKRGAEFVDEGTSGDSLEALDSLQWLRNSRGPWATVEKRWNATYAIRRRKILEGNAQAIDTLREFPVFKDNRGRHLLEIDFEKSYPNHSPRLFTAWPALCDFIVKKIRECRKSFADDTLCPDYITNLVLTSMSQVFPVVTARRQNDTVKNWRPSKSEAQDAFVLHVPSIATLDSKLSERRRKVLSFGCYMQPIAVLVGPLDKISQCFVVVDDNFKFEVETPLKAVDLAFKCFHVLHADYPAEASQIWQFLQRAAYGIPRNAECDPHFTALETIIREYENSSKWFAHDFLHETLH